MHYFCRNHTISHGGVRHESGHSWLWRLRSDGLERWSGNVAWKWAEGLSYPSAKILTDITSLLLTEGRVRIELCRASQQIEQKQQILLYTLYTICQINIRLCQLNNKQIALSNPQWVEGLEKWKWLGKLYTVIKIIIITIFKGEALVLNPLHPNTFQ